MEACVRTVDEDSLVADAFLSDPLSKELKESGIGAGPWNNEESDSLKELAARALAAEVAQAAEVKSVVETLIRVDCKVGWKKQSIHYSVSNISANFQI